LRNAEPSRDRGLRFAGSDPIPNVVDIGLSELRASRSVPVRHTPLRHSIERVVLGCPKEEVIRIHAQPVVAAVEDKHSCRNLSNVQFVGNPVNVPLAERCCSEADRSVPATSGFSDLDLRASPLPTTGFGALDFGHQSLCDRSLFGGHDLMNSTDNQ